MLSCLSIFSQFHFNIYAYKPSVYLLLVLLLLFKSYNLCIYSSSKTLSQKEHVNLLMKWAGLFSVLLFFFFLRFLLRWNPFFSFFETKKYFPQYLIRQWAPTTTVTPAQGVTKVTTAATTTFATTKHSVAL